MSEHQPEVLGGVSQIDEVSQTHPIEAAPYAPLEEPPEADKHPVNLLKTLPGLAISGFFLWWTFRGFKLAALESIRLVAPLWILGLLAGTCMSYGLRSYRWWLMMRSAGSKLSTCFRVLMTSLAANNILPLRIGDLMRIFTYAPDLNASPSVILSTVILEKLLDVFTLVVLLVATVHTGRGLPPKTRILVKMLLLVSGAGLMTMIVGSRALVRPIKAIFAKLPPSLAKLHKIEHWLLLALDAIRQIGMVGMVWLFFQSLVIWLSESFLYFSAMQMIGLRTALGARLDWGTPMQVVSLANFAFLVPSAPGGIGPFEWACKGALVIHGVAPSSALLFGLLIHFWLLVSITGVGGGLFLAHRLHRARRKPLLEEIETLPAEML
ncbi:MAG: lysylphosphatidylglycerol synthase transmembrane domain-containing protein [Acidobacteriaceae bacterium]